MPARSRIPVVAVALALLIAGSAYASNGSAPGAEKKQDSAAAPAPQPSTKAPAPKANAKQPVNQGAVKKTTPAQTRTTSPATSTQTTGRRVGQRARTAPTHRTATPTRTRTRKRPNASTTPRRTRTRARTRPNAPASRPSVPASTHAAAAAISAQAGTTTTHGSSTAVPRARAGGEQKQDGARFASISQAADHVVEVIPGIVILALAWLAALSLMLIIRSLASERRRRKALTKSYGVTVEALAVAIEAKDHCTGGHIERVRRLGLLLAGEIAPRDVKDPQMAYGFLLHDIGKLAVPDAILRAPGHLSDEQWALMRRHPEEGVRMLASVPFLDRALDIVRHHHERWDGRGYPDGLRGEEIPLWARIFSVVDALDAMTAERPYRAARGYDEALAEIRRHAGTQFDPTVVETLERIDPVEIEPLLEPAQRVGAAGVEPLAELPAVAPLVPA